MREEALLQEWADLYEAAAVLKEKKPWETFWDLDLIGIQEEDEEDTIFFSILGKGDSCYGIVVYEGYGGLNDLMMMTMHEKLNLSLEYVMLSQNNLTCYWGDREELSNSQRQIIKALGYKFRGKRQWLYFMSYRDGYYPYNFDRDEVQRMTKYFRRLAEALDFYKSHEMSVKFEEGNMYLYRFEKENGGWTGLEEKMPFTSFQFHNLIIQDDELIHELEQCEKKDYILETELMYTGNYMSDRQYDRPITARFCLIAEAASGMIWKADLIEPDEDGFVSLVENLVDIILNCGAPKEIRVTNIMVSAVLEHLCEICGIKIRRVKRLAACAEFAEEMKRLR